MTISAKLRQRVADQAQHRCGYCLTQEIVSGIPLTIEHLIPSARGGQDVEENLWLSCRLRNQAKAIQIGATDPQSDESVALFNPRVQNWADHFAWDEQGVLILGLTAVGRATVQALSLNQDFRVRARRLWVKAGYHPPT